MNVKMAEIKNTTVLKICIHCFLANGDICHLLKTFAHSLDPDQDQQTNGPYLDPNHLTLSDDTIEFLKEFFEGIILKKLANTNRSMNIN